MKNFHIATTIEEYQAQREYRQNKRNEYLRKFQTLKSSLPRSQEEPSVKQENKCSKIHPVESQVQHANKIEESEEHQLLLINQALKRQFVEIENQEKLKLLAFKDEIAVVKNKYLHEIQALSESAKNAKEQTETKVKKISSQVQSALQKNEEIHAVNHQLKSELEEGTGLMSKYAVEIKKEYSDKIQEFEKIFNSSNEKILAMEKEFNEDEFVENTLKNEELLKSIEENAEKAEEAAKILIDYEELLEGKKEILHEIRTNVEMKEKEIAKMVELEGKIKMIMGKMNQEKKIYVNQNNQMATELIEIKNLLMGAMNEAQ